MNHNCPSCGKDVPQNASFCPHCGAPQQETAAQQTPRPAAAPVPPASGTGRTCPECGAVNPADAETCTVCGESLLSLPAHDTAYAAPAGAHATEKRSSSATRIYLIAGVVVLALAAGIYWATAPDQGPPMQPAAMQGENGALPPGHPPTHTGPTPEQQRMIDELKGKLAANPNDEETKLLLANVYYDANMHAEALPLYREYVKAHPDNEDARTDMAYSMYQTGDLEGAIAELKDITASDGKHQNAAYNLAMMYVVKRDRDSVRYWMDQVIAIDSTTAQAKNAREIIQALSDAHMGAAAPADTN